MTTLKENIEPSDGVSDYGIETAIQKGLSFLLHRQQENGSFECMTAESINCFNENMETFDDGYKKGWINTDKLLLFPTLLTGLSLLHLEEYPETDTILNKITKFLIENKRLGTVWNHFQKPHPVNKSMPYDIDDTVCSISLLNSRNIKVENNDKLILSNRNKKGLFYTYFCFRKQLNHSIHYWIIGFKELLYPIQTKFFWSYVEASRYDIDGIVNANVVYYLGERKETLPVIKYIIDNIIEGKEEEFDKWYKNPFVVYYFISKNYFNGITAFESIKKLILERLNNHLYNNGSFRNNPLDTALAICTLQNFKSFSSIYNSSIQYLIEQQLETGSWAKRIVYTGGPKLIMGWGSEEITTSFCLEALNRYIKL